MRSNHDKFNTKGWVDERTDVRKHALVECYEKFDSLVAKAIKPHHPIVTYQGLCGEDRYSHILRKATYLVTGDKRYIKFSSNGLLLWRYNKDQQQSLASSTQPNYDLIHRLSDPIDENISKYQSYNDGLYLPFDEYDLLVLQELDLIRPGDIFTGLDLCMMLAEMANNNKKPLVIRPHPFVKIQSGCLDFLASDYVCIDIDSNPSMLVKHASSVHGNTSSLLADAMVKQIPTFTYSEGEFYGGANGDIGQQNKWLSWYYGVVSIDIDSDDAVNDIINILEYNK